MYQEYWMKKKNELEGEKENDGRRKGTYISSGKWDGWNDKKFIS